MNPHPIPDLLADCDGVLLLNVHRGPPPTVPTIRRQDKPNRVDACVQCGGQQKGRLEVVHYQRVRRPEAPVGMGEMLETCLPLCPRCALAARKNGWSALGNAWRQIRQAPAHWVRMSMARPAGGRH